MAGKTEATRDYTETLGKMLDATRARSGRDDWLPALVMMAIRAISDRAHPANWEQHFAHQRNNDRWDPRHRLYVALDPVGDYDAIERLVNLIFSVDEPTRIAWLDLVSQLDIGQDHTAHQIFAKWFNDRLNDPEAWHRRSAEGFGVVVPTDLSELMASLAAVKPQMCVLDPACGTGGFLAAAATSIKKQGYSRREINIELHGVDRDADALAIGQLRLFLLDVPFQGRIMDSDARQRYFIEQTADIILSAPPSGLIYERYELGLSKKWESFSYRLSAEAAITMLALDRLTPQGRAALLIPKGLLFRGGDDAKLRRVMVEEGAVSAVINLPAGILAPLTYVETAILVLRKPHRRSDASVIMVDAVDAGRRERRRAILTEQDRDAILKAVMKGEPDHSTIYTSSVTMEVIRNADFDLRPERYLPRKVFAETRSLEERREAVYGLEDKYRQLAMETDELITRLMNRC